MDTDRYPDANSYKGSAHANPGLRFALEYSPNEIFNDINFLTILFFLTEIVNVAWERFYSR